MPQPSFLAVIDTVPPVAEQFVVCLGRPAQIPSLPANRLLVLYRVDEAALERIKGIDLRLMASGLVVVTSREEHARSPRLVLRAQKLLAYLYAKHGHLPAEWTRYESLDPSPARTGVLSGVV
jgi:predicted GNAT family N-acyltransferase